MADFIFIFYMICIIIYTYFCYSKRFEKTRFDLITAFLKDGNKVW